MGSRTSREIHLKSLPEEIPSDENFEIVERSVPDAGPGEVRVRNVYMSLDPAMRPPLTNGQMQPGQGMSGAAIGRVEQSRYEGLAEGDFVLSRRGWREYFVSEGAGVEKVEPRHGPLTAYLGVLGITGLTAYGGLLVTGELAEGETVFVSAAAGAVGSTAGQIARIKGCRVIGSCGSDEKVRYLLDDLGFDEAFNYRNGKIRKSLRAAAPNGIDVYFENVGGEHLDAALICMNPGGRIPVCGMISGYNNRGARCEGVTTLSNMIYNRITMRGFVAHEFLHLLDVFRSDVGGWLADGRLTYEETILDGLENAPRALAGLFTGLNRGKMLVRLGPEKA